MIKIYLFIQDIILKLKVTTLFKSELDFMASSLP